MKKIKKHYIQMILVLILVILLPCCKSTPKEVSLEWTVFPNPQDNVKLVEYDTVQMPLTYWLQIVEYVADTETNIKIIESEKR